MDAREQGLQEAREYYRIAQADHVTEIVREERKRRSRRRRQCYWYPGVSGDFNHPENYR